MAPGWDDTVRALAWLAGIQPSYQDALGNHVDTPIESIRAVLAGIGIAADSEAVAHESLAALQAKHAALAPRLVVATDGSAPLIEFREPSETTAAWRIVEETGATSEGRAEIVNGAIALPILPAGYHEAVISVAEMSVPVTILVAPPRCWHPDGDRRRWGLAAPVYGLVSAGDLGIGDFGDVALLAKAAADRGASFLGLSPTHALFTADRTLISPYSPSSRLFLDPIYVDPRKVAGQEELAGRLLAESAADGRLARALAEPLVNYEAVWALKRPILHGLWAAFRDAGGSPAFEAFRAERGRALARHATFEAFAEAARAAGGEPYEAVPAADSAEITAFQLEQAAAVGFQAWLQWLADEQLGEAQATARASGMDVGLLADLAVGAEPSGSDVWGDRDSYLATLSVGAPPDQLAPHGQNWNLRGLNPRAMERSAMAGFRALVSANMRHAGGIRIDHAFQLRRLFLIPDGLPANSGAYLAYPTEAMLAVLRIESHRARCMVIGEDLGTSPPDFATTLRISGILGYRVLYFEREHDNSFRPPAAYTPEAMAVINTHDLATLRGWWRGRDIEERLAYGITDAADADATYHEREVDRHRLMQLLRNEGLFDGEGMPAEPPVEAVVRLLARSRSELVGVQADDVVGAVEQQNVPGVVEGAPNWRRRLPMTIAELAAPGGPLDRFAGAMAAEGRHRGSFHRSD